MPKIKDLPKHKRPREKLLEKGVENLTNSELLAILLRTGIKGKSVLEIARIILKKYKLKGLLSIQKENLKKITGINDSKICTVLAAFELTKRATKSFKNTLPVINSIQSALDQLSELRNYKKEHFIALYLNARKQMIGKETISIGSLNTSLVYPRDVFQPAIKNFAETIIIAHNHPSNDKKPSKEDILVTENLARSGKILDIKLKDHLIITKDDYFSFQEKGMIHD